MKGKEIISNVIEIGAKTALSVIPVGGELISSVWDAVKSNAAEKRMNEWKSIIEERLHKLEVSLDDIGNNELFTSALMKATDAALRTAEENKREYLANVVNNSILCPVEESKLMMFLDLVDRLTVWHVAILRFFRDPTEGGRNSASYYYMGSPSTVLKDAHPELTKDMDMVMKIVRDLQSDGLMHQGEYMNAGMTAQGMVTPRTTHFGNEFLDYITK